MGKFLSPLRYPGGKASLYNFLARTIEHNNINYGIYAEGFAGGAGAALKLLMQENISDIYLNDKDLFITNFWKSVINSTDELCKLINDSIASLDKWKEYKRIIQEKERVNNLSELELGFIGFYLNRVNRSGILSAGPIGGTEQLGKWKIDARYNKNDLIKRIQRIALYKERIHIKNMDIIDFLNWFKRKGFCKNEALIYLDPPYVEQGQQLYKHYFTKKDHIRLATYLQKKFDYNWLVSYDDNPLIHEAYKKVNKNIFEFNYFANKTKVGRELIISSKQFLLPESYLHYSKKKKLINQFGEVKAM